jgi:hypothetical protein
MANEISMTSRVIHIDETLDAARRESLLAVVREANGVIAVGYHNEQPHLMIVVFNPENLTSANLLSLVNDQGVHAEFTGG